MSTVKYNVSGQLKSALKGIFNSNVLTFAATALFNFPISFFLLCFSDYDLKNNTDSVHNLGQQEVNKRSQINFIKSIQIRGHCLACAHCFCNLGGNRHPNVRGSHKIMREIISS